MYTVSYLILFSILGTLARLGLQALAAFPGAPITTPIVWANFAGCLIMGFLAEDRKLFLEEWGDRRRANKYSTKQERRARRRQEKELLQRSKRYSRTAPAPSPFTNANTASLYPVRRVLNSGVSSRSPSPCLRVLTRMSPARVSSALSRRHD